MIERRLCTFGIDSCIDLFRMQYSGSLSSYTVGYSVSKTGPMYIEISLQCTDTHSCTSVWDSQIT